jgi:PAS domain S-box-containing protein
MKERFEDRSNLDQLQDLQRRLQTSDALLSAIVQNAKDVIIARDLDSNVIVWNTAAEQLYGWTAEEMIGSSIYRIVPDDKKEEHREVIRRARLKQATGPIKTDRVGKNGRRIHIVLSVSPIISHDGEVLGASAIEHEDMGLNE